MLRRYQIDIMHIPNLLKFDVPFGELFGGKVKPIALMRYVLGIISLSYTAQRRVLGSRT